LKEKPKMDLIILQRKKQKMNTFKISIKING